MTVFKRRKQSKDYEEDYDDYYYDDDDYYYDDSGYEYDDDDYYYDDEEEEKGKSSSSKRDTVKSPKKEILVDEANEEKDRLIQKLTKEKEELEIQFASLQALPKHYQQIEEDYTKLQAELEEAKKARDANLTELEELKQKNERLDLNSRQFQKEINAKQTEVDQLTNKLLNTQTSIHEVESLQGEVDGKEEQLQDLRNQLNFAQKQVQSYREDEKRRQEEAVSKEDIADVMLDARAKGRQIIDQANYEAKRIVADAERQLSDVSQDAGAFYQRIYQTKGEAEVLFEEMLGKLTMITDLDKERKNKQD